MISYSWCYKRPAVVCRQVRSSSTGKKYSDTLNLPTTKFPLRPDHSRHVEPSKYQALYDWQRSENRHEHGAVVDSGHKANHYILLDGPPYANGKLHAGHALNKILKDFIVRRKVIEGYHVKWAPGWDCHGLPIEIKALQEYQTSRNDGSATDALQSATSMSPAQVRQVARKLAVDTVQIQSEQFQQMALCADWNAPYQTLDRSYEIEQIKVFSEMVAKGLIYRAEKPVFWSPSSRTALAEAELEYAENHVSHSVYVAYPLSGSLAGLENVHLLIWTTTPWTLPANCAIAVNAKMSYSVLSTDVDERLFIVATELVDKVAQIVPGSVSTTRHTLSGQDLIEMRYVDVFRGYNMDTKPILCADYVSSQSGTGLVHTAPGHGQEDYLLCRQQEVPIPPFSPVDDAGNYTSAVKIDALVGLNVQDSGSRKVIEILQSNGTLLAVEKYKHKYPYDWRTKKPIIVRSTPQFFANLAPIKSRALETLGDVRTVPQSGKAKLMSYVHGRDEWCISRQRSWGVPIPALYNEAGDLLMSQESIDHIISVLEVEGIDSWFAEDESTDSWQKWLPPSERDAKKKWTRGRETLDVWFDSGCAWTTLQKGSTDGVVADVCLEGSDQHRGWFQSSLLTSIATRGIAPYKQVLTHGFVLDDKGRKMSKSLGNVIDPMLVIHGRPAREVVPVSPAVIDKKERKQMERLNREAAAEVKALGVDTLRLWVASSDFTSDVIISNGILTHVAEALRKFRTTLRYLLGNLEDFNPEAAIPGEIVYSSIDNYALAMSAKFFHDTTSNYENYSFNRLVTTLNHYTNAHLSAFYFDTLKDRLYADSTSSPSRLSAQRTLFTILQDYMLVLAPICPVLIDDVWQHLPNSLTKGKDHIYASDWYSTRHAQINATDFAEPISNWQGLLSLRDTVNKQLESARSQKLITSSLQASIHISIPSGTSLPIPTSTLPNLFIVSEVLMEETQNTEIRVVVRKAKGCKCPRCWTYTSTQPDTLCIRCDEVLS